jgi:hypothetical protein
MFLRSVFRSSVLLALVAVACVSLPPAFADRVIMAPSADTLFSGSTEGAVLQKLNGDAESDLWMNVGLKPGELEGAAFLRDHRDTFAASVQTLLLPAFSGTPSVAVGVRDITNATHGFGQGGYYGRGYYAVAEKALNPFSDNQRALLRDVTVDAGMGGGALHGLFGGITAQLPLNLLGTVEYDTRTVNARLALPLTGILQLQFVRVSNYDFVGIQARSPLGF